MWIFFIRVCENLIFYLCCHKSHSKNQHYELFIVCKFEKCKASPFLCPFPHSLKAFQLPFRYHVSCWHMTTVLSQNWVVIKIVFNNSPKNLLGPELHWRLKPQWRTKAVSSLASFMKLTVQVVRDRDGMEIIIGMHGHFLPVRRGLGEEKELAQFDAGGWQGRAHWGQILPLKMP